MGGKLRKEVLAPSRHQTGAGIMLAASACMFLAVASSAFLLRVQAVERAYMLQQHSAPVVTPLYVPQAPAAPPSYQSCGQPTYEGQDESGTIALTFSLCEKPAPASEAPANTVPY